MKKLFFATSLILLITTSCFKQENYIDAEVVRDCTGTYMHMNNQDYKVCNKDKVSSFEDGEKVKITFNKLDACTYDDDVIYCMMLHANAGWIKITKIK